MSVLRPVHVRCNNNNCEEIHGVNHSQRTMSFPNGWPRSEDVDLRACPAAFPAPSFAGDGLLSCLVAAVAVGQVLMPGNASWCTFARIRNAAANDLMYTTEATVLAANDEDVAGAVRCASQYARPLCALSGRHSYGSVCRHGGVLLDLAAMKRFDLDVSRQVAVLGTGLCLGEVYVNLCGGTTRLPPLRSQFAHPCPLTRHSVRLSAQLGRRLYAAGRYVPERRARRADARRRKGLPHSEPWAACGLAHWRRCRLGRWRASPVSAHSAPTPPAHQSVLFATRC
jgi:hypothetical protein